MPQRDAEGERCVLFFVFTEKGTKDNAHLIGNLRYISASG